MLQRGILLFLLFSLSWEGVSQNNFIRIDSLKSIFNLDSNEAFSKIAPFSKLRIRNREDGYVYPELGISLSNCNCLNDFDKPFFVKNIQIKDINKLIFKNGLISDFDEKTFRNWYINEGFKRPDSYFYCENKEGNIKFVVSGEGEIQMYVTILAKSTFPDLIRRVIVKEFQNGNIKNISLREVSNSFVISPGGSNISKENYFTGEFSNIDNLLKKNMLNEALSELNKLKRKYTSENYFLQGKYARLRDIYNKLGKFNLAIESAEKLKEIDTLNQDELGIIQLQELYLLNHDYQNVVNLYNLYYPKFKYTNSTFLCHSYATFAKILLKKKVKNDIKLIENSLPFINYNNFNWTFKDILTSIEQDSTVRKSHKAEIKSIISNIENSKNESVY